MEEIIKTFTLRLAPKQHDLLEKRAKDSGMSKNDYIRSLLENEVSSNKQDLILDELSEIKNLINRSLF